MDFNPMPFFKESYQELRKSTWLNREQLFGSTAVVFILVSLLAVYASFIDFVLATVISALFGGTAS